MEGAGRLDPALGPPVLAAREDAQHGAHGKRWASRFACWRVPLDQRHQVHLVEKLALARPLAGQLKSAAREAHLCHHDLTFEEAVMPTTYAENP